MIYKYVVHPVYIRREEILKRSKFGQPVYILFHKMFWLFIEFWSMSIIHYFTHLKFFSLSNPSTSFAILIPFKSKSNKIVNAYSIFLHHPVNDTNSTYVWISSSRSTDQVTIKWNNPNRRLVAKLKSHGGGTHSVSYGLFFSFVNDGMHHRVKFINQVLRKPCPH